MSNKAERPIVLKLLRTNEKDNTTIGYITLDGKKIFDTLEGPISKDGYKYDTTSKIQCCIPEGRYYIKLLKTQISDGIDDINSPLYVQGKYLMINGAGYIPTLVKTKDAINRTMKDVNYGNEIENVSNVCFYAGFSLTDVRGGIVVCNNPLADSFVSGDEDNDPWEDVFHTQEALNEWVKFVEMIEDYRVRQQKDVLLIVKNYLQTN